MSDFLQIIEKYKTSRVKLHKPVFTGASLLDITKLMLYLFQI